MCALLMCRASLAQTESTEWYVGANLYATTSCETGGDISTPPQNPTKKGHTFQGWETATFDLATLDTSINGSNYTYNNSTRKWRTTFSYGYVYGESLCSPTPNAGSGWYPTSKELDAETGTGQYCYCRATEFLPTGSSKIYEAVASRWVFYDDFGSASFVPAFARATVATTSGTTRRCALASSVRFRNDVLAKCRGAEIRGTQSRQGGLGEGVPHHRLT